MAPKISLMMEVSAMVYFPGQNINGIVKVESKKKTKCKSLSINFNGFASVSWSETVWTYGRKRRHHRVYAAQETYYEGQQQLWADPSQEIPAGASEFPFTFVLPLNSPASFVGKHGQVVHQITIKLNSPLAFKDIKAVQPFSVNAVVDLNHNPSSREPQMQQTTHNLCCWCCKSGPLSLSVRLDKSGYAPGEPISINAEINNKTKTAISGTKAKLIMVVTYKATDKMIKEQHTLTKITKGPIAKKAESMWENDTLMIPPLPPSPLPGCNIIDVCYELQFIVNITGANKDLMMRFPINLGTIPTVESFPSVSGIMAPSAPPAYAPLGETGGETSGWAPFPGLEQYPNIPPPTYQQAIAAEGAAGGKVAPYDVMEQESSQPSAPGAPTVGFTPFYVSYDRRAAPAPPQHAASSSGEKPSLPN